MNKAISKCLSSETISLIWNIFWAMFVYMACRFVFFLENHAIYTDITFSHWLEIITGGMRFDLTAVLYTNILLILLLAFPCHLKYKLSDKIGRIYYVILNGLGVVMNLCDTVYFRFTGRRTTCTIFQEFEGENNLLSILKAELINHWYLVLTAFVFFGFLYFIYKAPKIIKPNNLKVYYLYKVPLFALIIFLTINGIRGGFGSFVRPITLSNANQYTSKATETTLVLNTPFSMIRTIGKKSYPDCKYFDKEELATIFSPIHQPNDSIPFQSKNVVVIIWESLAREYVGALNTEFGPEYVGYTPFIDSLITKSLTFKYSYSTGRKSIDAMPSILSSIPRFIEPFILSPYYSDRLGGLATELNKKGYYTAFFHGAPNGSMGFQSFARRTGFKDYYGMTEYVEDNRFGGEADYDGTWAIWDEKFLQYYATKMSEFKQPFLTSIFTATSHHPFVVPQEYENKFSEGDLAIHKPMQYTDYSFRKFFEFASKQDWYKNTIFVITGDHSNMSNHDYYNSDLGAFGVPVIIFDPSGETPTGIQDKIAQQTDIMPTVLCMLHYDEPYLAFGFDLINTPKEKLSAINHNNGIYQFVKNGYYLQFDGTKTTAVYALSDTTMTENLNGKLESQPEMEREMKAIIQQYMERIKTDQLVVDDSTSSSQHTEVR